MKSPISLHRTSLFQMLGMLGGIFHIYSNVHRILCKQTVNTLIIRRVLRPGSALFACVQQKGRYRLIWVEREMRRCFDDDCQYKILNIHLHDVRYKMSQCMRFPTMWYVRPAKPQISLRRRAVWSEPVLVAWIFYENKATGRKRRLHWLVRVYTCQITTLLEITCCDSNVSEYDLEMPQSHTTDLHMAPRTRVTHGAAEKLLARFGCTESVLSPCMQEWKFAGMTTAHWACGHWCSQSRVGFGILAGQSY